MASIRVATTLLAAAKAERKPTLQVTGPTGVEFRGKLVFILFKSISRICFDADRYNRLK
jgi:hypothetical protein